MEVKLGHSLAYTATSLLAILGNCLVTLAILLQPALRTAPHFALQLSLACSDLGLGLSSLAWAVLYSSWDAAGLQEIITPVYVLLTIFPLVSVQHTLLLALERLVAVTRPLHYDRLTRARVGAVLAVTWAQTFLLSNKRPPAARPARVPGPIDHTSHNIMSTG
jgi:hypothetical protein